MIRRAELADIPELMQLILDSYREMNFDAFGYHFDGQHIITGLMKAAEHPGDFIFLCSEHGGILDGIFFAPILDTTMYFKGHRFAQEIGWHSSPRLSSFIRGRIMLHLLMAAEIELDKLGVPLYLSTDLRGEFEGVGRFIEQRGYKEMCRYWYRKGV